MFGWRRGSDVLMFGGSVNVDCGGSSAKLPLIDNRVLFAGKAR